MGKSQEYIKAEIKKANNLLKMQQEQSSFQKKPVEVNKSNKSKTLNLRGLL